MISARRKQNHISKLQRSDDEFVDEQVELCGVAELYFDDLFTSSTGNIQPHNWFAQCLISRWHVIKHAFVWTTWGRFYFHRGNKSFQTANWSNRVYLIKIMIYWWLYLLCGFEILQRIMAEPSSPGYRSRVGFGDWTSSCAWRSSSRVLFYCIFQFFLQSIFRYPYVSLSIAKVSI